MSTSDLEKIAFKRDALKKSFLRRILENRLTFSITLLFIILIQNILTTSNFFDISFVQRHDGRWLIAGYIPDILDQASYLVIVTLGMTLVTAVAGGQDISVGAIMAVAASFCGVVLNGPEYRTDVFQNPLWMAILAGLFGGALCGAFNGFLVSILKIQPMIASLILFTCGRSIAKLITYSQTIYITNPAYQSLAVQVGDIPVRTTIIISILMVVIVTAVVKLTSLGINIESIGINSSASRLVGINATRIKLVTFIICGMLCAVAGMMASSAVQSVNSAEIGLAIELDAILAVALGGTLLSGGKFSIAGSVIGAYTIRAITTTMYAMNVRADQLNVFKAVIIVIIIVASSEVFKEKMKRLAARLTKNRNAAAGVEQ